MKAQRPLCLLCWLTGLSVMAALCWTSQAGGAELDQEAVEQEQLPEGLKIVAIKAYPEQVELSHRLDYRQLLLMGELETGEVIDVTRMAELAQKPQHVSVLPRGVVRPAADGTEQLVFTFAGQSVQVPVTVSGVQDQRDVSFVRDVQPALSRMGCNAGTCHGSKDGKNGFKLSLRGYDPLYDHRALTDDIGARRFNRAAPDQSLILLKGTGTIPHVGGVRTSVDSPYYQLLRAWIASGARLDLDSPRVTSIDILPKNPVLPRPGIKQQMVVMATYSDGSQRDVTQEAFVESGDIEVIQADDQGLLTLLRRGEAPVLVRYEGAYAATTLTVMGDRSGFVWQQPETYNYVDELVYKKLERVKILPSELCTDEEFVRRIYLDLTGLPPTADQVRRFLDDPRQSRQKREELVDQLVGNPEFVAHWTNKWADLLQVNRKFLGEQGAIALRNWIEHAVATNMPYDQFAYEVLTASGSTLENPPAAYHKVLRDPADAMENTTHLFLALRFNCNKCHDHPFERWTQDQYYELAAYFSQIARKGDPAFEGQKVGGTAVEGAVPLVEVIYDSGKGEIKHDRTGQTTSPSFPYQHELVDAEGSRRERLARWITSPENQYFASSFVNRLWGYMFGRGIIEPIDDIRAGNPPTNPELLDALTREFIESGFDIQHMFRTICKSRAYQHSVRTNEWNEGDEINYSHALPRRLPAEVLYDAIHLVAGSTRNLPGVPAGFRAAELPDAGIAVPFLDDFGRPVRESPCECERSDSMVLGPIMKLINGPTVAEALNDPNNELAQLVARQPDDRVVVEEVFLRFLARRPTERELQLGTEALNAAGAEYDEQLALLQAYQETLPEKQRQWEQEVGQPAQWVVLEPSEAKSEAGATLAKQEDHSILVSGTLAKDTYTITAQTDLQGITGIRLELLPDAALPAGGPGRAPNGNLVLSELKLQAAPAADPAQTVEVKLQDASASFSQQSWDVAGAIDGKAESGWGVSPKFNQRHVAAFQTHESLSLESPVLLSFTISQQYPDGQHALGKFRISLTTAPRPVRAVTLPENVLAVLAVPPDERSAEQQSVVTDYYRSTDGELARLQAAVDQAAQQRENRRLIGTQDLAWALINNPAFLFNR